MTLGALIALQNAFLIGALVLASIWESVRPHQPFARSRDRLAHIARNLGFGLLSIVIASVLLGQLGLRLQLWGEASGVGVLSFVPLPLWAVVVMGVLTADLSDYLFHRFCHEWRVLWLMHSVHHSDPQLDVSTSLRTHPGQTLFAVAWRLLVAFALGIPVWVVLLRDVLALGNSVLHHANISWPERIDVRLRRVFVTPAMHKTHHSPEAAENNSNYGSLFSFWDRLFGTYAEPDADASPAYGLRRLAAARDQSVTGMLMTWLDLMEIPVMSIRLPVIAIGAASFFSVFASAQPLTCTAESPDVVCTGQGSVRGMTEGRTLAFKGIPYAQPPVGPLRWKPPVPAVHWDGVRDGGRYGAMCPQIIAGEVKGDEDCLYVNVWRPRDKPDRPLPVMVWLTGGGNHSLSGEGSGGFGGVVYNGELVVPEGVIFVSYNLRLGALGFLAHAVLDGERPEKVSGNYGSLDQIAMLQWIQRNIAAFGGDPSRVFLFGTSAGGGNICALMTSPFTRGLIHGVAMQSSVPAGCELPTLADARSGTGQRVVSALGCDSAPDIGACLRGKSAKDVVAAVPGTFSVLPRLYGPNVDGHVFPDQPSKLIAARRYPALPVIIGTTTGETGPWADTAGRITDEASYAAAIDKVFGAAARERIFAVYPASAYSSPRAAFAQATTDAEFTCQSRRVARALARAQREPVYRYLFNHTLDNDPELKAIGASHTIEHPFLFSWQGKYRPTEADLAVQRHMTGYWTRLAKAGNPNGGGAPEWPAAAADKDSYLEIGATTSAKTGDGNAHCDFWDGVPLLWPHI